MGIEALIPIFGILIVLVPITGLTLILTMRFAMKPFVETLATALKEAGFATSGEQHVQIEDLKEQVVLLAGEVQRLQEVQAFDRELIRGPTDPHAPR